MRPVVRRMRRTPKPAITRPLDHDAVDAVLGGGLTRGAVHEILAEEAGDCGAAHGSRLALALRLNRGGRCSGSKEDTRPG